MFQKRVVLHSSYGNFKDLIEQRSDVNDFLESVFVLVISRTHNYNFSKFTWA